MSKSKELHERKKTLAAEIKKQADRSNDKDRKWTAEDQANWEKLNADYDAASNELTRVARVETIDRDLNQPVINSPFGPFEQPSSEPRSKLAEASEWTDEDANESDLQEKDAQFAGKRNVIKTNNHDIYNHALRGWCNFHRRALSSREEKACRITGLDPRLNHIDIPLTRGVGYRDMVRNIRAESRMTTSAAAGGELIPAGFVPRWERAQLYFNAVRAVAETIRTETGNPLPWPTTNDTANKGELLAEAGGAAIQDVATSSMSLTAYKYSSKIVKCSAEILQDSAFDLASELGAMLGERVARILQDHFTTGTGSGQPNGLVTAATSYAPAGSTGAITIDRMMALVHQVDVAYRSNPGAAFMMNDANILVLRQAKDSQNRYLWQSSLDGGTTNGQPDRFLGYPVYANQTMATTTTNGIKSVLFGDLSKYKIRDVASVRFYRLVERFRDNDQEGFIAFTRHGGNLLDAGTNPVKVFTHTT